MFWDQTLKISPAGYGPIQHAAAQQSRMLRFLFLEQQPDKISWAGRGNFWEEWMQGTHFGWWGFSKARCVAGKLLKAIMDCLFEAQT
jgi:hypothetical protein